VGEYYLFTGGRVDRVGDTSGWEGQQRKVDGQKKEIGDLISGHAMGRFGWVLAQKVTRRAGGRKGKPRGKTGHQKKEMGKVYGGTIRQAPTL